MKYEIGNMLDAVKNGIILQQVNAQGVMASGIAKEIRTRWPIVWDVYSKVVTPGTYAHTIQSLGKVIPVEVEPGLFIVNIVGQHFYGRQLGLYTSYEALDRAFAEIALLNKENPKPIHHPLIGCGLGGGDWSIVAPLIENHLGADTTLWRLS